MSITESCHFKVSYDPSEYLAGVALQSAETHLGESLHLPIKYIALCQVPIKHITTAFWARYSKVDGGVDNRCNVLSIVKSRQGWLLVMFSTWQGR
jgi:hypothetical protein